MEQQLPSTNINFSLPVECPYVQNEAIMTVEDGRLILNPFVIMAMKGSLVYCSAAKLCSDCELLCPKKLLLPHTTSGGLNTAALTFG